MDRIRLAAPGTTRSKCSRIAGGGSGPSKNACVTISRASCDVRDGCGGGAGSFGFSSNGTLEVGTSRHEILADGAEVRVDRDGIRFFGGLGEVVTVELTANIQHATHA